LRQLPILEQILFVQWIAAHCTASAYCSLFSRYGVRGFPAILLVNETTMVRYRGSKDLISLVDFYKETTGTTVTHHRFFKYALPETWGSLYWKSIVCVLVLSWKLLLLPNC
jgi:hypothetical protein